MNVGFGGVVVVLMVFYLYLLVRWQYVRRPLCYLLGMAGWAVVFLGWLLGAASAPDVVMRLLSVIGAFVVFTCAVGACFGARLPVWENLVSPKPEQAPAAIAETPKATD